MSEPVGKVQVSLRVPADLVEVFQRIADQIERDRSWVMIKALRQYAEGEGNDLLREAAGFAALDRGEGYDFDEVLAEGDKIIAAAEAGRAIRKAG